ncbi:MAG: multicopper oxidase domain-containing protein [Alphaproteobacteria bacterium]|nr:multicopper oxidase domain-containing protein [Alphaproteobacteria bacterium]
MIKKINFFLTTILLFSSFCPEIEAKIVEYRFTLAEKKVNFSGAFTNALAINDSIPGPTLTATIGDTLRVVVTNHMNEETSIHWHGVLVPNHMDGVPYINQPPIKAGETFVYEFPVKHSGTYWYHAHSALQEQQGIYGALVFQPQHKEPNYDEEHVVVLSDWTDEHPDQVLANLKKDPDYYALKKDSVQSWAKVLENGMEALTIRIKNAWTRAGPMDMSDIGYDAFLINGKASTVLSRAKPGSRVKLRLINAAASSYFILEYSGGPMKVIESDGVKISPFTANKIRIAMAETYDIILTIPENNTYEFRASAEDGTGYALAHIGQGDLIPAAHYPKPDLTLMDMSMDHGNMSHSAEASDPHSHNSHTANKPETDVDFLNNYKALKSPTKTTLPIHQSFRDITLKLTGSMERYVWNINDTPMYASDHITVKKGENIRFNLVNETMMNHPIHLHGHFFRVLNDQGEYSPLKHTVDVRPFETVVIEFDANEEKDWIFHCHNLYHMKLGMGGILSYEGSHRNTDLMPHEGNHSSEHGNVWFQSTEIAGYSNFVTAKTRLMRNNDNLIADFRHNYKRDFESELAYQHYVSQFLALYTGGRIEKEDQHNTQEAFIGIEYTLPLLINSDLRINTKGKIRFGLANEHQLTDRLSLEWHWNTNKEYTLNLNYAIHKQINISVNYDSKERFGIGAILRF